MDVVINHLVDIIIAVIAFAIIVSSFYRPTHKFARRLVGLLISFLAIFILKTVHLFNVVEVYLETFFASINFKGFIVTALGFIGYGDLAANKVDAIYYLSIVAIFGLVIYFIVTALMGLSHRRKTKRAIKQGEYKYSKPLCSFILSTILLVIGIFVTTILFKTLPFDVDYVGKSYVLSFADNLLQTAYTFVKPYIAMFDGLEHYSDVAIRIIG